MLRGSCGRNLRLRHLVIGSLEQTEQGLFLFDHWGWWGFHWLFSDNRTWLLRNSNTPGTAQISFAYGSTQFLELPVVGDWDGNGTDTPAVLRNRPPTDDSGGFEHWLFRNSNSAGSASGQIIYGSDAQEISPPIDFVDRLSFR